MVVNVLKLYTMFIHSFQLPNLWLGEILPGIGYDFEGILIDGFLTYLEIICY